MTASVLKIFKTIFIILFYFLFESIVILLLPFINIDFANLPFNLQILIMVGANILTILILYLIFHKSINENIKDYKRNFKEYFNFGIKYWVIGLIVMIVSNNIIAIYVPGGPTNEAIVESAINKLPLYMFFSSIIYAPIVEELIFRKNIREMFPNNLLYILISGLVFGGIHLISATSTLEYLYIIPYSSLGIAFAYMYTKTDNICVPITFHMLHNLIVVSMYFITLF